MQSEGVRSTQGVVARREFAFGVGILRRITLVRTIRGRKQSRTLVKALSKSARKGGQRFMTRPRLTRTYVPAGTSRSVVCGSTAMAFGLRPFVRGHVTPPRSKCAG